eukprot:GDKK01002550.1.p1 GENE.GDKK01002550.1~~GDKK01002550.1.p1  ORF type:complete len:207 (-),score=9.51 GDKK01002550.1:102-722(-)
MGSCVSMLRGGFRSFSAFGKASSRRSFKTSGFQKSLLFEEPVVKPPSRLWKVFKYSAILVAAGGTAFLVAGSYSLFVSVLSRKYVTQEDMHSYRSMERNMLVDYTMDEMEEELLDCAIDVDEQIYELMEEREPTFSEGVNQQYSKEAFEETKNLLKAAIFGNERERRRAWNDHYSFYYTYIELDELQKLREEGHEWGTTEEQNRWR